MKNLKELRELRAAKMADANALAGKESLTSDEETRYNALIEEVKALDKDIDRAVERDELNRRSISQVPQFSSDNQTNTAGAPVTVNVIAERKADTEKQMREDFRLLEAMKRAANGQQQEGLYAEVAQEAEKEARSLGVSLSGNIRIPGWLATEKRDMTVGTATAGGHTVATNLGELVPILDPSLVVRAAGATYLTGLVGNLDLPRHTTKQTAAWAAEQGALSETDAAFDKISLTPNRLGAITDYSKTLLAQSSIGIENFVRNQLNSAVAIAVDIAALHGRNTANQPGGIVNANATATNIGTAASGVGTVVKGTNGGAPVWADLVNLEAAVAAANADYGTMAYIVHPNMVARLKQTEKATNTGLFLWGAPNILGGAGMNMGQGEMNGYRAFRSTLVPSGLTKGTASNCSYIYFGNWAELVVAQWGGLDIVVDPYTQAANGNVRVVVNSWWDVDMLHPQSFAVALDTTV